jgi:formate dehydrogenase subunit gamma
MASHDAAVPRDEVVRYSFSERLCHWLSGLAYVYCLISGLALFTPYLYWLAALVGGGAAARFWHPWAGLVFLVAIVWMHSIWRHEMRIDKADREWMRNIKYYVTHSDELTPPQGKHNAGQKQFYWIMFYGSILLLISGLVMWFPEVFTLRTNWVRQIAIMIHAVVALVTIGAFIIHVYMGVFLVPGSLHGMISGHVSRRWARWNFPHWYAKETGDRSVPE